MMEQSAAYLVLIPLLPLVGALLIGLLHLGSCRAGNKLPEKAIGILGLYRPVHHLFLGRQSLFRPAGPAC